MKFFQLFAIASLALVSSTEAAKLDKLHYIDKNFDKHHFNDILNKNKVVLFGKTSDAKSKGLLEFLGASGYDVFVVNVDQQLNQSGHKIEHWLEHKIHAKGEVEYPQVWVDKHHIGGDAKVRDLLHHGVLFKHR